MFDRSRRYKLAGFITRTIALAVIAVAFSLTACGPDTPTGPKSAKPDLIQTYGPAGIILTPSGVAFVADLWDKIEDKTQYMVSREEWSAKHSSSNVKMAHLVSGGSALKVLCHELAETCQFMPDLMPNGAIITYFTDAQWLSATTNDFKQFDVIYLNDVFGGRSQLAPARNTWGAAITGRVAITGSHFEHCFGSPSSPPCQQLVNTLTWIPSQQGTGLLISTQVRPNSADVMLPSIPPFNGVTYQQNGGGWDAVHITEPGHVTMQGRTDESLSNFGQSSHSLFANTGSFTVIGKVCSILNSRYPDTCAGGSFVPYYIVTSVSVKDQDWDGIIDDEDNCQTVGNTNQLDSNHNGYGDACESAPKVTIVPTAVTVGLDSTVVFTAVATDDDDALSTLRYEWRVDGIVQPATGLTFSYSAASPGRILIRVTVRDPGELTGFDEAVIIADRDQSGPVVTPTVTGTLGLAGWYTSDVTVSWTTSDPDSPITSPACTTSTLTTNTASATYTCSATSQGGTTTQSVTVKRDASRPTVDSNVTGVLGTGGWYTSDIGVSWSATANGPSGATSSCVASTVSSNTTGQTFNCTGTSGAGLTTNASVSVKRDASSPTVTPTVTGDLGQGGWYTSDVSVSWSAIANGPSGATSTCATSTVSSNTAGQTVECSAVSGAGKTTSNSVTVKRDAAKPMITPIVTGTLGINGWYTSDANVAWVVTAAGPSGVSASCSGSTLSVDSDGTPYSCTATSNAGLSDTKSVTVKRDASTPSITPNVIGTLGLNGWYTSDVGVSWTVTASGPSGVNSSCESSTLSLNSSGTTYNCAATSGAGRPASGSVTVKRDASTATITPTVSGTLGTSGWYTSDVGVSWAVSANGPSNQTSSCVASALSSNSTGTTYNCLATTGAGLPSSASVTVKRDASTPTVTPTVTGTLGSNGWYTSDVGVSWSVQANGPSDVSSSCASSSLVSDSDGTTYNCTATSGAGRSASNSVTVKRDGTTPEITATIVGSLGNSGWYTSDVSTTWSVTSSVSGITKVGCTPSNLTSDSDNVTYDCAATTGAGLSSSKSVSVKRDASVPTILPNVVGTLGSGGWYTSDVSVSWDVTANGPSDVTSSCVQSTLSSDTAGATYDCTATSGAGKPATKSITVKRDASSVDINPIVTGTLGTNGWYTSDVGVSWDVKVNGPSGMTPDSGCSPATLSTDSDSKSYLCSATTGAGRSSSQSVTVKRDATKPTITPSVAGTLGSNGWYTSDVNVSWDVKANGPSDASSSCAASTLSTDSDATTYDCTATSGAGLSSSKSATVKRDASTATITPTVTGTLGSNGWYTSDVSVSWNVQSNGPSLASSSCVASTLGVDSNGSTYNCTATTGAGRASSKSVTVKRDASTPTVTPVVSGTVGLNGWYTSDVDVSWNVQSHGPSDVTSSCSATTLASNSDGSTYTCTATSGAGTSAAGQVTVKRDASTPSITPSVAGTLGSNGWYTSDVGVSWGVAANGPSSVTSSCVASTLSTDSQGTTYDCSATSGAGLTTSQSVTVKRDATTPEITATIIGTLGNDDWYRSDVSTTWSVTEGVSGVTLEGCTASNLTTDTESITYNCAATSGAGLTASKSVTVKRDTSTPVITPVISGRLGANGWYTSDVGISWDVKSSGPSSCAASQLVTDSDGTTYTCSATSISGATATKSVTIKRDATTPEITATIVGTLGSNGWYRSDVSTTWSVTSSVSGVTKIGCVASNLTTDTDLVTYDCAATTGAGLSSSKTVSVKRDAAVPTVTPTVTGTLGSNGWYTSDVHVSWSVTSNGPSDVSSSCAESTLSTDSDGTTYDCTATSASGASASKSVTVKRDASTPTITPAVTGTLGNDGWYTSDVGVSWTVASNGPSSATSSCVASTLSNDSDGTTYDCTAVTGAGLTSSRSVNVKRDATVPEITATIIGTLGDNDWYRSDVSTTWSVTRGASGITLDGCTASNLTTDAASVTYDCVATTGSGRKVSKSVTVKRDASTPVITPVVSGRLGSNGWYTSDVDVSWTVEPTGPSPVTSSCVASQLVSDSDGTTYNCTATSAAGATTTKSVTVKRDGTTPEITATIVGTLGNNGWYRSDVSTTWDVTSSVSGITKTGCVASNLATDSDLVTYDCSATTGAGLSASKSVSVKRDASAPTITPSVTGTLGSNGWYTSNVGVTWDVKSNGPSAVSSSCAASTLATDSNGTTYDCTATSAAGASASRSVTVKRDASTPTIAPTVTGVLGSGGWYTSDVGVSWSVTANGPSAATSSCVASTLATDSDGTTYDCSATTGAGLTSSRSVTVKRDATVPEITATIIGTLGNDDWYRSDVSTTWSVTKGASGITVSGCTASNLTTDAASITYDCVVTTGAGLRVSKSVTVKRDASTPTITPVIAGRLGSNGWYTSDVDVSWDVKANGPSPVTSSCVASQLVSDSNGSTYDCTATSAAGATASKSVTIKRDGTTPEITATLIGTLGNNGWYRSDVSTTWDVTSSVSGVTKTGCVASNLAIDTNLVTYNCAAVTGAGLSASKSVSIKRDASAPTITPTISGTLGSNGWYTSNVGVTWDVKSNGPSSATSSCVASSLSSDSDGTTYDCTAVSGAGTSASKSVTVKRDASIPEITATIVGTLGNDGWYRSDLSTTWSVTNGMSGVSLTGCTPSNLSVDASLVTYTCAATTGAGRSASKSVSVKRDATKPLLAYTGNAGTYSLDQNISIGCSASDALSGLASNTCRPIVASAASLGVGTFSYSATASDKAGNSASATTSFKVVATTGALCALVRQWVYGPGAAGVANSLCVKISHNNYPPFINELQAQSGKHLTPEHANILIAWAKTMI